MKKQRMWKIIVLLSFLIMNWLFLRSCGESWSRNDPFENEKVAGFYNKENEYTVLVIRVADPFGFREEFTLDPTTVKVMMVNPEGKTVDSFWPKIDSEYYLGRKFIKVTWYDDHAEVVMEGSDNYPDSYSLYLK